MRFPGFTDRDYLAEMDKVIDRMTTESSFVPGDAARKIVRMLLETDVELLEGWLGLGAETFLTDRITARERAVRAQCRRAARGHRFRAALDAHQAGDDTALRDFLSTRYSVADGTWRRLAELRRADLLFVSNGYARRADENALMREVMRQLAEKVGDGTVAQHYTNEELAVIFGHTE
jgi:hypothetical protein